jgi:hypothetical protein
VDGGVAPPESAQAVDVIPADSRRRVGHLDGEITELAQAGLEVGLPIVVRGVLRELIRCALGTEVVGVRANSVVAVVRAGDDDRQQLALGARELGGAEHDRPVEIHRRRQHRRVQ